MKFGDVLVSTLEMSAKTLYVMVIRVADFSYFDAFILADGEDAYEWVGTVRQFSMVGWKHA